jgi:hypothetical protein
LQSLQGGAASQYYHLTATEYSVLGDAVAHDDLVSVQGGLATVFQTNAFQLNAFQQAEEYHLTSAQHAEAIAARSSRGVLTVDDLIVDLATKGLVLKDTQGTPHYWRVTISNVGAIVTTDVGTSAP